MFKRTLAVLATVSCCMPVQAADAVEKRAPMRVLEKSQGSAPLPVPSPAEGAATVEAVSTESSGQSQAVSAGPEGSAWSRWEVKASDITLARTLERWAHAAGHKLKWDASRNFLIGASDAYLGSFEGALQQVLSSPGIRFSDYPLEACIYANSPPLVRITRQGEQTRECVAATAR